MPKKNIRDLSLEGKKVLVRVDFNVPMKTGADGSQVISDDSRIRAAIPTIEHLTRNGAKVILMSHLGRPDGERKSELSLKPAADHLGGLINAEVKFVDDCVGDVAVNAVENLANGEILVLENVRFYKAEEANDEKFARQLAEMADIFVNDAFGTAHRAHASTTGVAAFVKETAIGFLMELELKYLLEELKDPAKPFIVIIGGKKVSDKIGVIESALEKASTILIGGAMAYTFRRAQGHRIGNSFVEESKLELAKELLEKAGKKGVNFVLPADTLEADGFSESANVNNTKAYRDGGGVTDGWEGIDIGKVAIKEFCEIIQGAKTILWNGPMGVFEIDQFAEGTKRVAEAVANADAVSIIGGGDSVTAINKFGFGDKVTFMSTGGGASLELLEGKTLPGVAAIQDA